jgi:hypothetical protein
MSFIFLLCFAEKCHLTAEICHFAEKCHLRCGKMSFNCGKMSFNCGKMSFNCGKMSFKVLAIPCKSKAKLPPKRGLKEV